MISEMLLPSLTFTPLVMFACAVAMVVLRAGASRVFFDIVGVFQANRLIKDAEGSATVLEAIYLDAFTSIQESATEITDIFGELVEATVPIAREIEEARIQFDKFLADAERSPEVFESISEIGLAYGFAADEAYEASARMAQLAGTLGQGTTPLGTEIGMQFGLISGMETEEAMQRLINLQQQTKFMTQGTENAANQQERLNIMRSNSIRVLDELNTVENRSAATMKQITYVMNQFASQAHLTGESIAAMAAMSATLIEAGEEQGKGGRALRMIYARLGADTNGARTTIEKLGISVIDTETGAMRPFSDILEELAAKYQTLEGAEQQALAQSVAGNRHYTRLIKLLENVDRVRELEEEALTGMFPAMEEIERRRDTELFQLEQAEKQLRNYQAAFGETMIDDMKAGVDLQIVFYDTLTQASNNRALGVLLDFFTQTSILMKVAMGPMTNFMLSIFNMGIAIKTLTAIQEASKAATTSGTAAYTNQYGQLQESIHLYGLYSSALHEINKEHTLNTLFRETQDIPTTREAQAEVRKEILALMEKKDALIKEKKALEDLEEKRSKQALATERRTDNIREEVYALQALYEEKRRAVESAKAEKNATGGYGKITEVTAARMKVKRALEEEKRASDELSDAKRRLAYQGGAYKRALKAEEEATKNVIAAKQQEKKLTDEIHEGKRRFGAAEIKLNQEEAQAQELRVKSITQSAKAYNNLSIALSGAGMAMMLFRNNERMQRAGMILNGVAVAVQIVKLIESAKASMMKFAATLNEVVATEAQTAAQIKNNMMQEMGIIAKMQYTLATRLATAASISFAAALTVVTAGGMAILAGLAYLVAGAFKDTASSIDETTAAITNLNNVAKIYEDMTLGQINNELREQEKIIEQTKDATQGLAKEQHDAAVQRKNDLLNAKDAELAQTAGFKEFVKEYASIEKDLNDTLEQNQGRGIFEAIFGDDYMNRETAKTHYAFFMGELEKENKEYYDALTRMGIDNLEELEDFNTRSATMIAGTVENSANAVADSFSDATEEMQEFNNAREELFFGGSASNLTGNLIRQVQQQGVENLITTTEVVMTNVFNGLTIPEMADKIIEEIEYRGYALGYKINA